ncbi:MAG TPA: acyl-CoA dehydrogenase family protein [Noviherbaspirillum sp.]|nr:acyl-CoA dehydrogenase family protein [Noviherbaspirillum sp.]
MNMNDMTDEIRLIADSAFEFTTGSGGLTRARAVRDKWPHFDKGTWEQIAGLGWLGIAVPEENQGLGLGPRAMCALLESVGRKLLPEPLVPVMASAAFLAEACTAEAGDILADLLAGKQLVVMRSEPARLPFPLKLSHVPNCHPGTMVLVAQGERNLFEIRAVAPGNEGIAIRRAECVDGSTLSDIVIEQQAWSRAPLVASGMQAQAAWEKTSDMMLLGDSAYLVGLMDAALQMAIEYMKIRKQFGTPIGTFQALQHRAASAYVDVVSSRALVYEACNAFETASRARAACASKARASAAALRVTKECIQFHGAIGFADEHDIGLFLRKAMAIAARQGGEMAQKVRYGQL